MGTCEVIYGYVVNNFNALLLGIFPQRTPARTDWPTDSLDATLAAGIEGDFIADCRFLWDSSTQLRLTLSTRPTTCGWNSSTLCRFAGDAELGKTMGR